ncbi:MAG TPA: hypothetical protein VGJ22_09380 [Anaerolineales bacterium]
MSQDLQASSLHHRITAHAESVQSLVVAFFWGLAEATLFFIVPDVYLGLIALFRWRRGLWGTAAAVAGALIGGALMYGLAMRDPAGMNLLLTRIPLIDWSMLAGISSELHEHGLIGMINGPFRGVPYKVYAVQAGGQCLPFGPFLLMSIVARLERILPVTLLAGGAGVLFRPLIERRTRLAVGIYAAVWGIVYLLYYLRFR